MKEHYPASLFPAAVLCNTFIRNAHTDEKPSGLGYGKKCSNFFYQIFLIIIFLCCIGLSKTSAQSCIPCESDVTTVYLNLAANPDTSVVIKDSARNGLCCSAVGGQRCIKFIITINPQSNAISFSPSDAGVSGFYQINCGTPYSTGSPACISGMTTFCLTYCKVGGDKPDYTITVARTFKASDDLYLRGDGNCPGTMSITGAVPGTINWTSISPGAEGAYNSFLSSTTASTVTVNPTFVPAGQNYIDYKVCATATSCVSSGTICDTVRVYVYPALIVSVGPATPIICTGGPTSVQLTATPSGGKPPYTYSWIGPGGFTSTSSSPTVTTAGTYTVTVQDSLNCPPTASNKTVTLVTTPTITSPSNGTVCTQQQHSYTITGPIAGTTYTWSRAAVAGILNPAVSGQTSNPITETLFNITSSPINVTYTIVPSAGGCTGSPFNYTLTVYPKPTPGFMTNDADQCINGNSFVFTNTSIGAATYLWSFGDGNTSTQQHPTHTYTAVGTYQVKLVVTSANGCKDSVSPSVIVYPAPAPAFTINDNGQCLDGNNFIFTNTSSVSSGTYASLWSFGDGNTSIQTNPTHSYAAPGTYQVKLVVTTNNGCKDSVIQTINVFPEPSVDFTINDATQCLSGNSFVFTNNSDVLTGTMSYSWSFGDGNTSTQQNPSHTYAAVGTYNVKLVVSTNEGCIDSITKSVTVYPQPVAVFTLPANQCLSGNSFTFNSTSSVSSGTITNYDWSFGDGNISTQQNPTHTYVIAGTYNVKLIVTTNNGCKDSITQSITIHPQPIAGFILPVNQCLSGNSFVFTNTSTVSTGTITNYNWSFGDGNTSTQQSPTHTYVTAGTYNVKLVVTTNNGCKDSIIQSITVHPQPIAAFTLPANQCLSGNSFTFTNTSTISNGSITNYDWNFGDGNTSAQQNPTHTYTAAGTYNVKLVVTTNNGCKDSITQTITVHPQPVAGFTLPSNQCLSGNSFAFTNTSTVSTGTITNYNWNFGDGNTSTQQNPIHTYTAAGTYNVKLVVTTNNGCKDSITQSIIVHPQPVAAFVLPANQCLSGNSFIFNSTSTVSTGSITTYNWNFGDGNTSTQQNPSHTYASAGIYNVKLVVTTDNGCKDSITQVITVHPQPATSFNLPANQCLSGNSFSFNNTSTVSSGSITNYNWSFGDGNTSTQQNPMHIYGSAGTYNVKLVVTTNSGCKDSIIQTITTHPQPVAAFTLPVNQCLSGNSFTFNSTSTVSTGTIINYNWFFGDGNTSTQQNPSHTYNIAGSYNVKLVVTTDNGCKDSITQTITVHPQPVASFALPANQCLSGNSFVFNSTSTVSSGTIVNYEWNFGDGNTSTQQNPTHSFTAAGSYQVKLVVTTNNGCKDSIIQTITVHPQPVAGFTLPANQCLSGNSFGFTNTSTVSTGTITNYNWSFGDGNTSTLQSPIHIYAAAGTYNVKLVVTTNNGCKDSITQAITVHPQPIASFTLPANQCLSGNSFSFTSTSTVSSGTITDYDWSFGDGNSSTQQNPTHTYVSAGTYNVKLVVTTDNGCKDSITQVIIVYPQPVASFTLPANQCLSGNSFTFNNTSSVLSGTITYNWNFGDGNTSTQQNPTHTYIVTGTYNIKLVVTTNNGCKDSITPTITVHPQPVASFTLPANQCLSGNSFTFNNTSTVSSGTITSYNWNFGDGNASTQQNPTHTYTVAGTYNVKLVVTTDNGCEDSVTQPITVHPQPVAAFILPPNQCLTGNSFTLNNTSTVSSGTITNYNWNFGDGNTSTQQNPTHSYSAPGTYQVKLVVTTNNGCKDSITRSITVHPQPVVDFTLPANQCLSGNSFAFNSTSTVSIGIIVGYNWNFGDGNTSTQQNPTHTYVSAGTYNVKLVVITDNGCRDSITKAVTVHPQPVAAFTLPANQCLSGNSFTFNSTSFVSTGSITNYNWSFGDGNTSTQQNPTHTYAAAGTYNVKLVVSTNNGCKDSITQAITVHPQPIAGFTIPANECLSGNNFTFTNTSSVSTGTIVTYNWNFGDGNSSAQQNPTHTYASAGTYNIKLVVTTNNGCKDSITQSVTIHPQPVAAFTLPANQCLSGNSFTFNSTSTVSTGSIINYSWSFGDGNTSTQQNPTHTYVTAGTYNVKLVVTTDNGCKDSIIQSITIYPQPVAGFTLPANQCLSGNNFTFSNTSTVSSGTIVSYNWNFGDGNTSTQQNPSHTYATEGTYSIKLVVTTNNGCKDSVTQVLKVYPQPVASFTLPTNQCLSGNSFTFNSTSSVSTGTITVYNWNFGDGNTSTQQNPTHSYTANGTYNVKLVVTTDNGCKDSITQSITVYPQPVANFDLPANQCLSGNSFMFNNTSTVSSGTITNYGWSFGDGNTSTQQSPIHTYTAAGTYNVKLVVITNNGCLDSITRSIIVYPQPVAAFTLPTNQCLTGNSFAFNNTSTVSTGSIVTYNWNFGDGNTFTQQSPTHTYVTAGIYNVKLVVTTGNGCKDSITQSVIVHPQPVAAFTLPANQCLNGNTFTFTSTSTVSSGTITTYNWSFGDGNTSTQQNPTHTYASAGSYNVKLVVTTDNGCKDSISQTLTVHPQPVASFTLPANQCLSGNSFTFNNTSTVSSGTITNYDWSFGDGNTSTQQNPTHTYAAAGTYQVKLVVTTANACKDSITQSVTIYPQPVAAFTLPANQCLSGNNFTFNSTSTVSTGTITNYNWSFGDGNTSTQQHPTHTYATAGTYNVKLVVTTDNDCKDSITQSITVYTQPVAGFTLPANQCLSGNSFTFNNTSTVSSGNITTYNWSFGDGNTSTQQSPTHTYAAAGTYSVKLVVTTNNGCKDSITQSITVYPQPVAAFTLPANQCLSGNSFTFNSTSTVSTGTITVYNWNFGDGNTSTQQNPTHTYAAAGTYNVKLLVTTDNGCKDSITQSITVHPQPVAAFTLPTNQCLSGNSFTFNNNSTVSSGTITTYDWNFSDGNTSTQQSPTHTYAAAGTYQVKLVVTTNNGCKDSITQSIIVHPQPIAAFTLPTNQCLSGNSFTFNNTSTVTTGTITNYNWNFGDGNTSNQQSPTHTYAAAGTYNVKLVVTTNYGCKDSITQSITVYPQPVAAFTLPANQCLSNNSFTFNSTSTVSTGTITNYNWNFGDGNTSTQQNPTHTYAVAGTYSVKLVVTTDNGCKDSITQLITVHPQPIAGFTLPANQCLSGNSFTFNNTSTVSSGTITTYNWNFGDGNTSTQQNPTHSYSAAGTYQVKLVVTTNYGCKDSITQSITVHPQPVAAFTLPSNQCLSGNTFAFNNTSTVSTGTIASYNWTFGDGNYSTQQNPTHTYAAAGTYNVKLVVTTDNGCKDSITQSITIHPQPTALFVLPANQCLSGNNFIFNNTSSVATGTITIYNWSFGDGNTSAQHSPTHTYTAAGSYNVQLIVTTNNGCKDSITQTIIVHPQPVASFTHPANQCLSGNSFSFNNTSTVNTGTITTYNWNFGDGNTSTQQNPTHTYAAAGTYQVKLVVTTNSGCKDSITQIITVHPQSVADFTINTTAQCLSGNSYSFTNTSSVSNGTITYLWNFGDGNTSTQQNPTHIFTAAGTYSIKLIVTTNNGCKDSITKTITVHPQPAVDFNFNNGAQCLRGNSFAFSSVSTISTGTITYTWSFGDGNTSTQQNPTHIYAAAGTYDVKLIVTTNNGCVDSLTKQVTVYPQPVADFSINTNAQCLSGNSFSFTNTSSVSSGTITYRWNFGDGNTSTQQNPTHTYATAGTYNIKLVVTSDNNCLDSITRTVTVNPQPSVDFNINSAAQCFSGNSFNFTNTASVTSGTITYLWNFGDGSTSTQQNPTHTYTAAGTYNVKLVVTTNNGCVDSITKPITVYQQPIAGFDIATAAQCLSSNTFNFSNTSSVSSGTITYLWNFGDGNTSTQQNPTHTYSAAGTNNIQLIVTSDNGCKDSIIKTITVYPQPSVNFNINNGSQCLSGNSFTFTSTSTVSSGSITYLWNFGDGNTSTQQNPTHSYTAAGIYDVKLIVSTNNGCIDSITKQVVVYLKPVVDFSINSALQCLNGNSVTFTNNSSVSSGTIAYNWNFGDGNTSTQQHPTHTYTSAGTYVVKLIVTTNNSCIDSLTKQVTIYPQPSVSFNINNGSQCLSGNSFAFMSTSTVISGTISYLWNFGDGNTSTQQNPTHTYTTAGTYQVKLIVTTDNGCQDSITQPVSVYPQPLAGFILPANQCLSGNSFTFTDTSTVSSGTITTYHWSFGDGNTSAQQNPIHSYVTSGTYNVKLVVATNNGCKDSITQSITVYPQPVAAFALPANQCLSGNSFTFSNNSTVSSGSITNHDWNFGDGNTSTQQSPTHTYTTTGTYQVKLVITTDNGCKDSITQAITVYPQPVAGFTLPVNQCLSGNSFNFTNTSTVSSGSITNYNWSLGGGNTSTQQSPTHTYTAPGTYNVKLVVTTDNGCKDSITQSITINPQPVVDFTINTTAQCLNTNSFSFTSNSTVSSGTITYLWSFGDGNTSIQQSPTHTYATAGTYQVKLVVTTDSSCKDSLIRTITVNPQPFVDFNINNGSQCLSGNSFNFSSTSTVSTGSISYLWSFGDGNTSTQQNPTHIYAAAGTYQVKLIVTTNNGCVDSITKQVLVYPQPLAAFDINSATQCLSNNSFSFTNTSSIGSGIITYSWSFGDGNTSTAQSPTHIYTSAGTYTIKLVVTSDSGCKDSTTRSVTVYPQPSVNFNINNDAQCLSGNNFALTSTSTVSSGTITYLWSFGDGNTSTQQNPTHSYAAAGTYNVKLIVTTNNGCIDSITKPITVYPQPLAEFTVDSTSKCFSGNSFTFTNNSSIISGTITYQWNFGDGNSSTQQNPTHTYSAAGTYIVTLLVTTNNGCTNSTTSTITVNPQPSVNFNINTNAQCLSGNSFAFTSTSTVSSGTITYLWNFGDGNTSTQQNPTHTYTTAGSYNVKLILTTNNGCVDSINKPVTVYPQPVAGFAIDSSTQCLSNNSFTFTNTSTISSGTVTYSWSFGDGNTSAAQSPVHTYATAGTYTLKLVVTSDKGCKDSTTKTITVYPQSSVDFNINNAAQCLSGNNFAFTSTSTVSTGTITYVWHFGDGNTSTQQNPTHTYTAAGTYDVKLIVTTNNGCIDSITKTIIVYPQPVADFAVDSAFQCISGNSFTFTNNSTVSSGTITYQWNFGDGNTSTQQHPTHIYSTAGTYIVALIVTSNNGCTSTTTNQVTVNPQPSANFNISNTAQCLNGNIFAFTSTSNVSSGSITYQWSFGDGNSSTQQNPSHTYTAAGTYQVKLIITTDKGCKDSITKPVTIYPQPIADFNTSDTTQCLSGNSFAFTNNSSISSGSLTYNWNFGDGNTSTQQNPTHTYTVAGSYSVKLIVTTNNGCVDSISKTVTIYPQASIDFTINSGAQCLRGNTYNFTSNASAPNGTVTYSWSFGDGNTSTQQNPTHTYAAAGTYDVKLVVTTNNGCKDSTTKPITVYPQPVADFSTTPNAQCLSGNSFAFANNSSVSSGTLTYNWNYGDGNTSTQQNPSNSYAVAGSYTVKLIVTSNNSCIDTISKTVRIYPQASVDFTVNNGAQCLRGNTFNFTSNASVPNGTVTYSWSFGDGNTSTQQNPTHTYTAAGTYQVKLVVTTDNGCKDSTIKPVTVYPQPVADFSINATAQCLSGNSVAFTNNSTITSGTITYYWNFGDGNTSTQQNPTYTYAAAGTYTVKLIVTSDNGCIDSTSKTATIYPQASVDFTINNGAQCLRGNTFNFTSNASVPNGTVTYNWNFGDGNTSVQQNPTHSYTTAGTYQVKLVVTTDNGCKDSITKQVVVYPQPVAEFSTSPNAQCLSGNTFSFTNNSTMSNGTLGYVWHFGDGVTTTSQHPIYTYTAAGTYDVKLIATSTNGCMDSTTRTINVYTQPSVAFNINDSTQCLSGNVFNFQSSSSVPTGTITYLWQFGDGNTSTQQNPSYTYATAGTYQVRLVVTTDNGCMDSTTKTVIVYPQPVADFNINNSGQCLSGNSFNFINNSIVTSGTATYLWQFGDGNTSTLLNPIYTYTTAGTYTVKLTVTTGNGCIDSSTKTVEVYIQPTAGFTINAGTQCLSGNSFNFTSTSNGAINYQWKFGDGNTSAQQNPTHTYTAAGTYIVKLIITSANGCKDSITQQVVVNLQPFANFNINNASQCFRGNNLSFTNTSNVSAGTLSYNWNFGDGNSSTQQNPTHTYAAAGIFDVKLIVTTNNGCKDSITRQVTINPQPSVSFTINTAGQCLSGNSFAFTSNSTVANGTMTYSWNFGDGNTSTQQNPTHTYAAAGTYIVKLIVTTNNGCKDSGQQTVNVFVQPIADFNINTATQCFEGNNFVFTNNSSVINGTLTYNWNFGDGNTSTQQNPGHTYTVAGGYLVKLLVTTNNGCVDSIRRPIVVHPSTSGNIVSSFGYKCQNIPVRFEVNAPNAVVVSWNFGDGNTINTSNTVTFHQYANAGVYLPSAVIRDPNTNCTTTVVGDTIRIDAVNANFIASVYETCDGSAVNLNDTSSAFFGIQQWEWKFGDGGTSTQTDPWHQYLTGGTYNVQLIVTGNSGCKDTADKQVTVQIYNKPQASITANNDVCVVSPTTFSSNVSSVDPVGAYEWRFSNGATSNQPNVTTNFSQVGPITAQLIVTTNNKCADTATHTINVRPLPTVVATDNGTLCKGSTKQLNVTGANNYSWTPSTDLSCTTCPNPIAAPAATTAYFVTGTSQYGCIAKDTVNIQVIQPFDMTVGNNRSICAGEKVLLSASGAATYQWFPSTGLNSSIIPNPVAQPLSTTTYKVIGKDNFNCFTDTGEVKITVGQIPILNVGPDTTMPNGATLQITPTFGNGPITSWSWSPSTDLSCNNCPNPVATVKKDITYVATITNSSGCRTTDSLRIRTFCPDAQIFIPNILTPDNDGLNDVAIVRGKGVKIVKSFRIYNRWGETVFLKTEFVPNEKTNGWDGTVKGKLADPDVFVYICEVQCENGRIAFYRGNITLLR